MTGQICCDKVQTSTEKLRKERKPMSRDPIAMGIRSLINERGMIQRVVAERAGYTSQQFSDMLNDRKTIKAIDDGLLITHPFDIRMIDEMVELIAEQMLSMSDVTLIAGQQYPTAHVKRKFLKLNYSHIEYIDAVKEYEKLLEPYKGTKIGELPPEVVQKGAELERKAKKAWEAYSATFGQGYA